MNYTCVKYEVVGTLNLKNISFKVIWAVKIKNFQMSQVFDHAQ